MTSPTRDLTLHLRETRSGNALLEAARDLDKAAAGADKFGGSLKGATHDAANLERAIGKTKEQIKDLNVQFARTGDRGLFGDIRRQESHLRGLEKVLQSIRVARREAFGGGGAPGVLEFSLPNISRGKLIAGLVGLIAYASPALGAMISGAVVGTVAGGGILGGIAAASRDVGVIAEAKHLGEVVTGEFFGAGGALVEPLKKTLKTLGDDFRSLNLGEFFAKGAGSVERLGEGISDLVKNLMPGFNRVMDQAEPYTDVFARGLANIGDAISDMIIEMLESEGTLKGLETLFLATGDAIRFTGDVINVLADTFDVLVRVTAYATAGMEKFYRTFQGIPLLSSVTNRLADAFEAGKDRAEGLLGIGDRMTPVLMKILPNAATRSAEAIDGMREALKSATDAAEAFTEAQRNLIPTAFAFEKSQDDAATATANLKDQLKEQREEHVKGAGSLKGNTQAARDNREAARDLTETYGNLIIDAASTGKSTKGLEQDFKDTMIQLFGNNEATQHYIEQLDRIPVEVLTKIFLETEEARHKVEEFTREEKRMAALARFDLEIGGKAKRDLVTQETRRELTRLRNLAIFDITVHDQQARAAIAETRRELNRLRDKTITIKILRTSGGGQTGGFAEGGWTPGGGKAFVVGERGPEIMSTEKPMYVTPNARVGSMASAGGNTTVVEMRFGGNTDAAFAAAFMTLVRKGAITIAAKAVV